MSTIRIVTGNSQYFEVDAGVANQSKTIRDMLAETGNPKDTIPLPNVTSDILALVLKYCKHHATAGGNEGTTATMTAEDTRRWDEEFVAELKGDLSVLFTVVLAANYLNVPPLLDLVTQAVANMIKGKSAPEIRATFNIQNDFTREEEEEIIRENKRALGEED